MSKFKVGDKCKCIGLAGGRDEVEVMHTLDSDLATYPDHVRVKFDDGDLGLVPETDLTLIDNKPSPIRTVTRKEIVPGVYGHISIDVTSNKYVGVHINSNMDAAELREAAHILNQIAEALEND